LQPSLIAFARYTLAGSSSSTETAQPAWFYLARLHRWVPLTAIPLLVWGWGRWRRNALFWVALPVIVLSVVHHKELRYLQNVMPFVAIAIGAGVSRASLAEPLPDLGSASRAGGDTPATSRYASGAVRFALLALTVLWAAWGVNRLERRSSSAVEAARAIGAEKPTRVAFAQAWAYGNHLYARGAHVDDLPARPLPADLERAVAADFVALFTSTLTPEMESALARRGFVPWRRFGSGGRPVSVFRRAVRSAALAPRRGPLAPRCTVGYSLISLD
jgi:hypothetical protein